MFLPSTACPHCTPPIVPPSPTRVAQSTSPFLSGSTAYTIPDLWPAARMRLPPASVTRIGDEEKSKSGPFEVGQLVLSARRQAETYASIAVACFTHRILPVSRSRARKASLIGDGGSL